MAGLEHTGAAGVKAARWLNLTPLRFLAWFASTNLTAELTGSIPRGNGNIWDVGNHIGNVTLSQYAGALGAVMATKVAEALPGQTRGRMYAGAVAGALLAGAAVNLAVETKTGQSLSGMFVGSATDWRDALYGEVSALTSAAIVAPHLAPELPTPEARFSKEAPKMARTAPPRPGLPR